MQDNVHYPACIVENIVYLSRLLQLEVLIPAALNRITSTDQYTMTPDDDEAYDNAPWEAHTLKAMLESDKREPSSSVSEAAPPVPYRNKHKPLSSSESLKSSTSSRLSNTDSGVESLRGASDDYENVSLKKLDDYENVSSRLEEVLSDMTTSRLDKLDSDMESSRNPRFITATPKKSSRIRTKKTKNGAMKALSK